MSNLLFIFSLPMNWVMFIFHQEKKYWELKESIRMMNSQRSDVEKINLIQEGKKKKKINEVTKCNEIINNSLK